MNPKVVNTELLPCNSLLNPCDVKYIIGSITEQEDDDTEEKRIA